MSSVASFAGTPALHVSEYHGSPHAWDEFVRRQRGWTHYHLYRWRDVIHAVHRHDCPYLVARTDDGALAGVLPLVRLRSVVFGHYLVSMPFLNYGGPLGSDAAVAALGAYAAERARREDATLLELRSRHACALDLPVSHRKVTSLLDFPEGGSSALWASFSSRLRNRVRRAQKSGLEVRFGADQVDPFFEVFSRHMRDLGTPTQPRRFFREIASTFPDDVTFGCGYVNGQLASCGCGFTWNGEFEMSWASALRAFDHAKPNMGMYWAFMERLADAGIRTFNFGRSTPGSGTHAFKQHWGARDEPLWWYDVSRDGQAITPSPQQGTYAWGVKLWQRVPVPVATAAGPYIVRYIP